MTPGELCIMRKTIIISIGLVLIIICVCAAVSFATRTDEHVERIMNDHRPLDFEQIKDEQTSLLLNEDYFNHQFIFPTGVLIQDQKIYILDGKENCINIFDQEGKLLEQIGSTGNGKLQFMAPHQICYFDNQFYILDSGNYRVQILKDDYSYGGERKLQQLVDEDYGSQYDFSYSDMAIDKTGNIYVSSVTTRPKNAHIYKIDKNGIIYQIGDNLVGYLASIDGEIFFANNMTIVSGYIKGTFRDYTMPYETYLSKLENDQLTTIKELPFQYFNSSLAYDDNNLFIFSGTYDTLDHFDKNGNYMSTLYEFEKDSDIKYLAYDQDERFFVATDPVNSKVYFLQE